MSPFLRTQKTCHHLDWLVPKLIKQMELSDSEHLSLVTRALISIFQNFIRINETNYDHLKPLRNMVVEAGVKVINFYYLKGDTFEMEAPFMDVLMALSKQCREKVESLVKEGLKDNFFNLKPRVAEMYINALYVSCPEETELLITDWIFKKVVIKRESPVSWGTSIFIRNFRFREDTEIKWNRGNRMEVKRN